MKAKPAEIHHLSATLSIWHRYDPMVKADLFATTLKTSGGICLVDPIRVDSEGLAELLGDHEAAAILITNANHARDAESFSQRLSVPVYAGGAAKIPGAAPLDCGTKLPGDLQIITVDGAAPGEIAIFDERDGGTIVMGDALINFGSSGFAFLPAKYCGDHKQMRKSLRKLSEYSFERMLFAHGTPILSGARQRFLTLLQENA